MEVLACPRCQRSNPVEANFCFFDGIALPGREGARPMQVGSQSFPRAFVFPNGEQARNFNQLAVSCQRHWDVARLALTESVFENFLRDLGRLDLQSASRQARATLDADRALDQLLQILPTDADVLQAPNLQVEPKDLNLGQMRPGLDRSFDVVIANTGARLLHGIVTSDCDWLVLGEGAGQKRFLFQTAHDFVLHVRVLGNKLRAQRKPWEGHLTIESSGGKQQITLRLEMPILPFPAGVLEGAQSPKEIARKALKKEQRQQAAKLFEDGEVERWYKSNGWDYPVQGPAGPGLGAVQQFLEAHGFTRPPVVKVDESRFDLSVKERGQWDFEIKVSTHEDRYVFAHAWSSQPWLVVGTPKCKGATARLPLTIKAPAATGETMQALLMVRANGNQRFEIPVTLKVLPNPTASKPVAVPPPLPPLPRLDRQEPPAPEGRRRKSVAASTSMMRMVYWSGIYGGWSALVGWLVAEILVGRWVGQSMLLAILMVALVAGAIGAGLSMVESMFTSQWHQQWQRTLPCFVGGLIGGLVGGVFGNVLYVLLAGRLLLLGVIGRILGWTLIGLAIGISEGVLERH